MSSEDLVRWFLSWMLAVLGVLALAYATLGVVYGPHSPIPLDVRMATVMASTIVGTVIAPLVRDMRWPR